MSIEGILVQLTPMRRAIARRMTESKQTTPHFYVSTEIEMDEVAGLLGRPETSSPTTKVTTTAALVQACAHALARHPKLNCVWTPDGPLEAKEINISVAIALDGGLVAPALLNAGPLSLRETATALADLVERARSGRLRPAELSDGTFTLSNLGTFDVSSFSAIITPPQVATLATGRTVRRVLCEADATRIGSVMTATLSADHRVLDGADAARFLQTLKAYLEQPQAPLGERTGSKEVAT